MIQKLLSWPICTNINIPIGAIILPGRCADCNGSEAPSYRITLPSSHQPSFQASVCVPARPAGIECSVFSEVAINNFGRNGSEAPYRWADRAIILPGGCDLSLDGGGVNMSGSVLLCTVLWLSQSQGCR